MKLLEVINEFDVEVIVNPEQIVSVEKLGDCAWIITTNHRFFVHNKYEDIINKLRLI